MFKQVLVVLLCCLNAVHSFRYNNGRQQMTMGSLIPFRRVDPIWALQQFGLPNPVTGTLAPLLEQERREMRALNPILDADVVEKDNSFNIHCDLPGVDPKDLDVTIDGDVLSIRAERGNLESKDTDTVHAMERWYGTVQRTLRLPPTCDADKADVKFTHGVLEICFPKKAGTTTKKKLPIKH